MEKRTHSLIAASRQQIFLLFLVQEGVPPRNLHFFAELGVRGTPVNFYKFRGFDSAQAAAPARAAFAASRQTRPFAAGAAASAESKPLNL